jgi:hypothetical protein
MPASRRLTTYWQTTWPPNKYRRWPDPLSAMPLRIPNPTWRTDSGWRRPIRPHLLFIRTLGKLLSCRPDHGRGSVPRDRIISYYHQAAGPHPVLPCSNRQWICTELLVHRRLVVSPLQYQTISVVAVVVVVAVAIAVVVAVAIAVVVPVVVVAFRLSKQRG